MSRRFLLLTSTFTLIAFTSYVGLAGAQTTARPVPTEFMGQPGAQSAQPFVVDEKVSRVGAPLPVQNVVAFETAFVSDLNLAIRNPEALIAGRKVVIIADTKAFRSFCNTKCIVVIETARVMRLSVAEMQQLRDDLTRQVDLAVQRELAGKPAVGLLGGGTYSNRVFTGVVKPMYGAVNRNSGQPVF